MGHLIRGGSSILHEGTANARTIMPNAGNQNSDGVYSSREGTGARQPLVRRRGTHESHVAGTRAERTPNERTLRRKISPFVTKIARSSCARTPTTFPPFREPSRDYARQPREQGSTFFKLLWLSNCSGKRQITSFIVLVGKACSAITIFFSSRRESKR